MNMLYSGTPRFDCDSYVFVPASFSSMMICCFFGVPKPFGFGVGVSLIASEFLVYCLIDIVRNAVVVISTTNKTKTHC